MENPIRTLYGVGAIEEPNLQNAPITGTLGVVRNLAYVNGRYSFSVNQYDIKGDADALPDWMKDGVRVEVDFVTGGVWKIGENV